MYLEEIKDICKITDTNSDNLIQIYENHAIEDIKSKIGNFIQESFELVDCVKNGKVFLDGINLTISSVHLNTWTAFSRNWEEVNLEDFFYENGILFLSISWQVKISYMTGFLVDIGNDVNNIPKDIKNAIILHVVDSFERNEIKKGIVSWGRVKKETVDGDTIEYESLWSSSISVMSPETIMKIDSLLSKYKSYGFQA